MERRVFLGTMAGGLLAAPLAAEAQQPAKVWRIGVILVGSISLAVPYLDAFRQGLRELGWVEGKNFALEVRAAEGKYERFPAFATDLGRLKVDIIVTSNAAAAWAAKNATSTIPIVMVNPGDPVGQGLVASLARPGGNVTGLSMMAVDITGKELAILKEAIPQASRVSVLQNPANADAEVARGISPKSTTLVRMVEEVEGVARTLGIQLQVLSARSPEEFDGAFTTMIRGRSDALLVLADSMFFFHRTRLADLATKAHLPTMFNGAEYVEAGGLMSYATNNFHLWRRAAVYVDRILKGAKPADLPIEQPTKFEMIINMKAAKALGLTIPPALLVRADQVIQ